MDPASKSKSKRQKKKHANKIAVPAPKPTVSATKPAVPAPKPAVTAPFGLDAFGYPIPAPLCGYCVVLKTASTSADSTKFSCTNLKCPSVRSSIPDVPTPAAPVRHDQRCISCGKNGKRANDECKHSVCDEPKCSAKHGQECNSLPELYDMFRVLSIADPAPQGQGPVISAEFTPTSVPDLCGPVTSSNQVHVQTLCSESSGHHAQGAYPPEPGSQQSHLFLTKTSLNIPTQERRLTEVSGHNASRDSFETKDDSFDESRPCPFCDGVFYKSTQERFEHFMDKDVKVKHKAISDARNRAAVKEYAAATGRKARQNKCELCCKNIRNDRELQAHLISAGHAAALRAGKVAIQAFSGYLLRAVRHDGNPGLPEVLSDMDLEPTGLPKELADHCATLRLGTSVEINNIRWAAFLRDVRAGTLGAAGFNAVDDLDSMEQTETDILDVYLGSEDLDDCDDDFDDDGADFYGGELSE
jgi:hypothetical protein